MSDCPPDALATDEASPALDPSSDPLFALLPQEDQAMFRRAFAPLIPAGKFIGIGRNTSYKASRLGHIPTVDICGQKFVSTAWLWETWRNSRAAAATAPIAA